MPTTHTTTRSRFSGAPLVRLVAAAAVAVLLAAPAAAAAPYALLHSFTGDDGSSPIARLVVGPDGNLYGTTYYGGATRAGDPSGYGYGAAFRITPAGVLTVLHSFGDGSVPDDGIYPNSLCLGADGKLYGTTAEGGATIGSGSDGLGVGTVFRMTLQGAVTILHSFGAAGDGAKPNWVMQGADGNLYGTTGQGGSASGGTIFEVTLAGAETVLHSFGAVANDGLWPTWLVQAPSGVFYGTTWNGGTAKVGSVTCGTLFSMDANGNVTILHDFDDGSTPGDGYNPDGVTIGPDGSLYGATYNGGSGYSGVLYRSTPSGAVTILHTFEAAGADDGANPYDAPTLGPDGNLYGSTYNGGSSNSGTIYEMSTAGAFTTLETFGGENVSPADGAQPEASPIVGPGGILYGTTAAGGSANAGTVYSFDAGIHAVRFDFNGDGDSDILWENSKTGQALVWDMNDQTPVSYGSAFIQVSDTSWRIVALPDVTGSGHPDLLWWNSSTGQVLVWTMGGAQGTTVESYGSAFAQVAPSTGWQPVAVGNDSGGNWTLWWENSQTGQVLAWQMSGTSVSSYGSPIATVPTQWHIVGAPDLLGTGQSGLLWWNSSTGQVLYWTMNGTSVVSYGSPFAQVSPSTGWQLVGAPALGGGSPDLLWWNSSSGQILRWQMNGTSVVNYGSPFATVAPSTGWAPLSDR